MRKEYFDLEELDDAVLKLAALGLLEIAGKSYQAEFDAMDSEEDAGPPPPEKVREIERAVRRQDRRENLRKAQKAIAPVITKAAVVFFVFFLGFSTVMITSADAREFFYQLVFTVHDRYSEVVIPETPGNGMHKACDEYQITYIPEGYERTFERVSDSEVIYGYFDDKGNFFSVTIIQFNNSEGQTIRFDTEDADSIQSIKINDSLGLVIQENMDTQIVWQNSRTYFCVMSQLPREVLIKIAEGIA